MKPINENSDPVIRKRSRAANVSEKPAGGRARPRYASRAIQQRASDWAAEIGLTIAGIEMTPDGTVRVLDVRAFSNANQSDLDKLVDRWDAKL